jgi:hypothetical protein
MACRNVEENVRPALPLVNLSLLSLSDHRVKLQIHSCPRQEDLKFRFLSFEIRWWVEFKVDYNHILQGAVSVGHAGYDGQV